MIGIVGDHCNIWLIVHAQLSKDFRAWEITPKGINAGPVVSSTGNFYYYDVGVLKSSPDRKKIIACAAQGLELYDFSPGTGVVSNPHILDNNYYYGASFSPDNSKVYVTSFLDPCLYQFDLTTLRPDDSKICLGSVLTSDLKLAPDGKIYLRGNSNSLSVINNPNLAGTACQYISNVVSLFPGTSQRLGLPNNVPIVKKAVFFYTSQLVEAGCFANTNHLFLQAGISSGWDYIWNNGTLGNAVAIDTPGTYWVSYYASSCSFHVDTFKATFPHGILPQINILTSCKNDRNGKAYAYTYPGDTVSYHYTWLNNLQDTMSITDTLNYVPAGNYVINVKTIYCDTTLYFYIPEENYPVSFQSDTLVCSGHPLLFHNMADPYFTSFEWFFGDHHVSALQNPEHTYALAGSYEVMLIGRGKVCTDTAFRTITVDAPLASIQLARDKDSLCAGQVITLTPEKTETASQLYWELGDGSSRTTRGGDVLRYSYDLSGNMPLLLEARFRSCPPIAVADTLFVSPIPKVNLGPSSTLCMHEAPITLSNEATNEKGNYTYRWSTGETSAYIKVRYPGNYALEVTNEGHCSTRETVTIYKGCFIDIPNAFTPNGDGINDYFFPRQLLSGNIRRFRMQVYNRWGGLLFETTRAEGRGWDGRVNYRDQAAGVYMYLIELEFDEGHKESYEGNVTLVR